VAVGAHLGSLTVLAQGGSPAGVTRYLPYGAIRLETGLFPTDRCFTGQRWEASLGLYDYKARFYDPTLGRFLQPDPLVQTDSKDPTPYLPLAVSYANPKVLEQWNQLQRARLPREAQAPNTPSAFDPQFLNRYAYARHNPLAYVDDSGHIAWWVVGGIVGGVVGFGAYAITHRESFDWREAALWTAGGVVVGATFGAGAQWVAGALGTEAAVTAGTAATTAGAAASSPAGQRTILWLEEQLPRVEHIMTPKHAWDQLIPLSGNILQDYRAIQPYIEYVIQTGQSK
jgi:RHS repeat-associated protein